ncbi:MAG: hypothetical protein ABIB11_05740, partial [Candidatus Omnitrophota bacterium]
MKYLMKSIYIRGISCMLALAMFFGFSCRAFAEDSQVDGVIIRADADSVLQVNIYNYTTKQYEDKITWSNLNLAQDHSWIIADQCLEITHFADDPYWGIQFYTDNENNTLPYAKPYEGKMDPAGIIGQITPRQSMPMAWFVYSSENWDPEKPDVPNLPNLVENEEQRSLSGGWHFLKDLNTPDKEGTEDIDESFVPGEEYVTIWNQKGIAVSDIARAGNPEKVYLFLAADFASATLQAYKTNTLTFEHFTDDSMSIFPFHIYKDGAPAIQMGYEFINAQMDKYATGNALRLIESYSEPFPPGPAETLREVGFSYDTALALSAYLARPTDDSLRRARVLCESFLWAQENDPAADGRWRDGYNVSNPFSGDAPVFAVGFESTAVGNVSWVITALSQYYKNSGETDTSFLEEIVLSIKNAGEFIYQNFYDSQNGGYYYGFLNNGALAKYKSTEHNIAAYIAFSHLYDITQEGKWLTYAGYAENFLKHTAWITNEKRYACGVDEFGNLNTESLVSDVNLLAVLALGNYPNYKLAIDYVVDTFYAKVGITEGVDFGFHSAYLGSEEEPDGIWFEGTALLAAAYKVAGAYNQEDLSAKYLESLRIAQHGALNTDYKGITAASKDNLTTMLGWDFFASPHIASTAWFLATSLDYNIYWGSNLSEKVPVPGDNITFTSDEASLEDDFTYLENHYAASGLMNHLEQLPIIFVDDRYPDDSSDGNTCLKIHWNGIDTSDKAYDDIVKDAPQSYKNSRGRWGALAWQEPADEWEGGPGKGYDLRGAKWLSFKIRTDAETLNQNPEHRFNVRAFFGYKEDSCNKDGSWFAVDTRW